MRTLRFALVVFLVLGALVFVFLEPIRRAAVVHLSLDYIVEGAPTAGARFDALDEPYSRFDIGMREVAEGFDQPVDLRFVPGDPELVLVVQRKGRLLWADLSAGTRGELLSVEVLMASEQGLLGLALHPQFQTNGRFFLNYVALRGGSATTVVQEWTVPPGSDLRAVEAAPGATLLEIEQPYPNHNGGQLLFGPDGRLYVPLGDGGLKDDIKGNGQDLSTLLGSILRLDVDSPPPYVPSDNPFLGTEGVRPEIWAYGVRNPWRSAFTPDGRLIVADVGQDTWEEVGFARRGASLGWNVQEGGQCFPAGGECETDPHVPPFFTYQHPAGLSVTGGLVYEGSAIPELLGRFLVADFVTGRIWAVPVPLGNESGVADSQVHTLGAWDVLPSSFTADEQGEVYIADYGRGRILRLCPAG